LRRLLADAARARRPAQPDAAGARRPGDGLRVLLGVPDVLRRDRAQPVPALAQGLAEPRGGPAPRRRVRGGRPRGHRAVAALQPLRVSLLDAPRLLRRPPPAERLLRDRRAEPAGTLHAA